MSHNWSRRLFMSSTLCLTLVGGCRTTDPLISVDEANQQLADLEARSGARIGVCGKHVHNADLRIAHRDTERFAMCSSFKWMLGVFMARRINVMADSWDRMIPITRDDLVMHSPVVETQIARGEMSIAELCRATITTSDNAAANLLLKEFGGPTGLTYLIREAGDRMTRLDRWEPELNEAAPGDERDTTTPGWMAWLMENLLFGRDEADNDIRQVHDWMNEAETGLNRLRAGLGHIYAGDKTGTNGHNTSADVAFGYSPLTMAGQDGPIVLASYINTPNPMSPETDKLHAEIGRIARAALLPDRS
ncbi:class A beta-lactamase [Ponticaulis profundi]|uniref:beta-lactamase n=1 Tax=Ponticaulis profundi TaxID=2665222 RepID=A0ABW1S544_9PROT